MGAPSRAKATVPVTGADGPLSHGLDGCGDGVGLAGGGGVGRGGEGAGDGLGGELAEQDGDSAGGDVGVGELAVA